MKSICGVRRRSLLVGAGCLGFTVVAAAQALNVKPGLWEVTMSSQVSGLPAMDMSGLTPDQRARMERAMKMGDLSTPKTRRECMTKEKIDKQMFQDKDMDPSCKRTQISDTPSLQEFKIECTGERKMSGSMRFEAVNQENVKGTIKMNGEGAGHTMNMDSTFTAKFISANCGDVK